MSAPTARGEHIARLLLANGEKDETQKPPALRVTAVSRGFGVGGNLREILDGYLRGLGTSIKEVEDLTGQTVTPVTSGQAVTCFLNLTDVERLADEALDELIRTSRWISGKELNSIPVAIAMFPSGEKASEVIRFLERKYPQAKMATEDPPFERIALVGEKVLQGMGVQIHPPEKKQGRGRF